MPLINLDFSQIEMREFAELSEDKSLIQLINAGEDLHYYTGSIVLNKLKAEISKEERDSIKAVNFGLIYGNGAKTASENTGKSIDWCKSFIDGFYEMFPQTRQWHTQLLNMVEKTGYIQMFDGVRLTFKKYPAKFHWQDPNKLYYNPPDIKNWPVQHTAFVIFSTYLASFMRLKAIHNRYKYLLVNTVHDSLLIDCRPQYVQDCINDLQEVVDKLPEILYNSYGKKFIVKIEVDIEVGQNWYEMR